VQMARDYDADLRAITGQEEPIALFVSQQSTFPFDGGISASTIAAWHAGVEHPREVVCIGPRYQYAYAVDRIHFDAAGYRRLGEKYAEVVDRVFRLREAWAPLEPVAATRDGATIKVRFHVPVPPLQWDETLAPPHQGAYVEWAKGRGFEVSNANGPAAIAGVAIHGDEVWIDLSRAIEGPLEVRYATIGDAHRPSGGDVLGRRGQLCDSDPFVGVDVETIRCNVEHGSPIATAAGNALFSARTRRDVVQGSGLAVGTIVTEISSSTALTLSSPWDGPTGEADLTFRYDERNYAVAFRLAVQ